MKGSSPCMDGAAQFRRGVIRHSYASPVGDDAIAYYNPFIDLIKIDGRLTPNRLKLVRKLERPHRQLAFNMVLCLARVFTGIMYDRITTMANAHLDQKILVPLVKDEFSISAAEEVIQKILAATRMVHEAFALLSSTYVPEKDHNERDSTSEASDLEQICLDYAETVPGFTQFRSLYQKMKRALLRVGLHNLACMVTWSLNARVATPFRGEVNLESVASDYEIIFANYPWSPLKRMEAIISAVDNSPYILLSELPDPEFFRLIGPLVPGWRKKEPIDCSFTKPKCFLLSFSESSPSEVDRFSIFCLAWKRLCEEWYQAQRELQTHRLLSSAAARVKIAPADYPTLLETQEGILERRDLPADYEGMVVLEYVALQLLDGDGLSCPFCSPECVSLSDCWIRPFLAGIWKNTEPRGDNRWEKPPCIE